MTEYFCFYAHKLISFKIFLASHFEFSHTKIKQNLAKRLLALKFNGSVLLNSC